MCDQPLSARPGRGEAAIQNRIRALLPHIVWYSIEGQARLAADCSVSRSTISRLVRGKCSPSYRLARAVTDALSKRLGVPLDMREVFTTDGTYPTACVCDLTPGCTGCFPEEAYDAEGNLRPDYRDLRPGDWCRYLPSPEIVPQQMPQQLQKPPLNQSVNRAHATE
jgi:transcriptional regulator with XRE-family HTH domain